ncbi:MAG: PAS domain S-box protein [Candidatus Kariarchaeaceae archaeon]|jgi:PAS domain S-box-containing protein
MEVSEFHSAHAVVEANSQGEITSINDIAASIFGPPSAVLGKSINELGLFLNTTQPEPYPLTFDYVINSYHPELMVYHEEPTKVYRLMYGVLHADSPVFTIFLIPSKDLQIDIAEEQYKNLMDVAPVGVIIIRDSMILYVNQKILEIYGYHEPEELKGKMVEILQPESRRENLKRRGTLRETGSELVPQTERYKTIGLRSDGKIIDIEIDVTRVIIPSGPATMAYIRDLTTENRLRSMLAQNLSFPFALGMMTDLGPQITYRDFLSFPCDFDGDLDTFLLNTIVGTISNIGRGSTYSTGISQLPSGICENVQMIVFSFRLSDPTAVDSRLLDGYFQFLFFVPRPALEFNPNLLEMEEVFQKHVSQLDSSSDLTDEFIQELKRELISFLVR